MSCHIVDSDTLNNVVSGLFDKGILPDVPGLVNPFGDALVQKLHALNVEAYNTRYRERDTPDESLQFRRVKVSQAQAAVSAACLLYQCCEGDLDKTPLYQALKTWRDALREGISKEELDAAQWG